FYKSSRKSIREIDFIFHDAKGQRIHGSAPGFLAKKFKDFKLLEGQATKAEEVCSPMRAVKAEVVDSPMTAVKAEVYSPIRAELYSPIRAVKAEVYSPIRAVKDRIEDLKKRQQTDGEGPMGKKKIKLEKMSASHDLD
ncbi:phosphoglycerate transport system sensor protein pgtB, partial [Striga asiatica]